MMIVTRKLEVTLGPDTGDLEHALVCTADLSLRVFYVVKSRFQLWKIHCTAARMEQWYPQPNSGVAKAGSTHHSW
jgi:hypothetical protein